MTRLPVRIRQAADGSQWISATELTENIFGGRAVPRTEWLLRRSFGASVTPEVIESVIRQAEHGYMRDLTDLTKETILCDPHFSTVVGKRFRALASVEPKVIAATGPGVDAARAALYAELVRQQLIGIPHLKQHIIRLSWAHCNGRAALEKLWREAPRTSAGRQYQFDIGELNWIHARRLSFGPTRELRVRDDMWNGGMFEARGLDIESIPHKFISYTPQLFDEYPEREGFGPRGLYYAFFKRFSWRERMVLLEVFGKPWRIIEIAPGVTTTPEQLDDAEDRADELGANSSAAMPGGAKLNLVNADPKSTDAHSRISQECDDQISKLVLGQTRTTDAKSDGLGGQQALVAQDGETLVINADGWGISEVLTDGIARDFVLVNFGLGEVVNAPRIELKYELAPDATEELTRVSLALNTGLPLKVSEVYARSGFAKPEPGDEVVTREVPQPATEAVPAGATTKTGAIPQSEGDDGQFPLAQTPTSLRLSRLSSEYFSRRF